MGPMSSLRMALAERSQGGAMPYGGQPNALSGEMAPPSDNGIGLREALAQTAAARGVGRAAERDVSHMEDTARFAGVPEQDAHELAEEIVQMAQGDPSAMETILGQLRVRNPQMAEQVMAILSEGPPA